MTDRSTPSVFFEQARKWADRPRFMVSEGDSWRPVLWSEYRRNVEKIVYALRSLGVKTGDKVGIYSDNNLEWIYSGIAIMSAQAVLVPIYHATTVDQGSFILSHADIKILFAQNTDLVQYIFSSGDKFPLLKYIILFEGDVPESLFGRTCFSMQTIYEMGIVYERKQPDLITRLIETIDESMIAQMLYTSGTTGEPKGVPLSYGNLIASTNDWLSINGPLIPPESVDLHWLPNSHIFGWGSVGLGNILGFVSYITNPLEVLQLMPVLRPHLFMSVPLYYEKLYSLSIQSSDKEEEQLDTLKKLTGGRLAFLLSGGAGLKRRVKEFFLKAGMWITEGYGLTECSPTLTMNRRNDFNFDSVGKPYPCVQLKLAEDGEILARGPVVFKGYYKNDEATRHAFTDDGWFKTGDVGRWLEGGFLQIIDRKKDIIVTQGGKNISPSRIEALFVDDPLIEYLVVYGDGKKYITALITLREESVRNYLRENGVSLSDWKDVTGLRLIREKIDLSIRAANTHLAPFEQIRKYVITAEHLTPLNGLLTPSLKIRRKMVYEYFKKELEDLYKQN